MVRIAKTVAGVGVLLGCVALWLAPAAGAAFSDSFAGRPFFKGVPWEITGSNVGAGTEAGEPVPEALSPAGHSVWVEWEAASSAYFTLSTCGSAIPTVLALYVGSEVSKLTPEGSVASYDNSQCTGVENGLTTLSFTGFNYKVRLDGNSYFVPPAPPPVTEGALKLQIERTPTPPNDDFGNAEAIAGAVSEEPNGARFYAASESGYNFNATKQTGEPNHAGDQGGASVWYTWTAPETGVAHFSLCCGTVDLLALYTGGAVNALTPVQSGKNSIDVPVTAGTTYKVAVDSEFQLFLGTPLDDRFNLSVGMQLAPGPGFGSGSSGSSPDTTPPETFITGRKIGRRSGRAKFWFSSNEEGVSFRCKVDKRPRRFRACASSRPLRRLDSGLHVFRVRAIDAAGNADPTPAVARFSIKRPPGLILLDLNR